MMVIYRINWNSLATLRASVCNNQPFQSERVRGSEVVLGRHGHVVRPGRNAFQEGRANFVGLR